jgi:peptidoglycan/LPS O-acetylase OafA/YrhL
MLKSKKLTSLEILRGVSVLAVCFNHFANAISGGTVLPGLFKGIEKYTVNSIDIFFVISGLVIPYSLHLSKYTLKSYFTFVYKRFMRMHPPYLIALAITLVLAAISYKIRHQPNPETLISILQSLFYAHIPTSNPVFWTLRIEAEYYLFIGVFFVFLTRYKNLAIILVFPLLLLLSQTSVADTFLMLKYVMFFLIGITGYRIYISEKTPIFEMVVLSALFIFTYIYKGPGSAIVSMITIASIIFYKKSAHNVLDFTGKISYSLYLIHFPIGIKMINLLLGRFSTNYYWVLFILAMGTTYTLAWLYWKYIEMPFARKSQNIKYARAE